MALDFNVDPWYDDFDEAKNYHRILFKPGRAVQARELTQAQTILQDQITKFADNIFKQNSPVTGGQITTNFNCYYVKLEPTYNDVSIDLTQWYNAETDTGQLVRNADGSVVARVVQSVDPTGVGGVGDPHTLILVYKTGNHFQDGDVIYDVDSSAAVQAMATDSTGKSSLASISYGVFYVLGNFVQIQPQSIVVDKYDNTPTKRVGLQITETVYDYINDAALLDPALGASNYQAPGADRYYIGLSLSTRPVQFGDDQNFVELVRIVDGTIQKMVNGSVYNVIDDYFAKREYETNGDYIVKDFKLTPKVNADSNLYTMAISKGLAYVHGYRVESTLPIEIESNRARTTETAGNNPVYIDYGNYFYVDNLHGANSTAFLVSQTQPVDIHCVTSANVNTYSTATYNATVVGSGYIRGLEYTNSTSDTDANTYVYKAFVHTLTNKSPSANAAGGAASTITLPSTYSAANDAYTGVTISITNGPSAGDFRTISAYNGVTKVATVSQAWTTTPTTASVFNLNFEIKDVESLVSVDSTYTSNIPVKGKANINTNSGKINGDTVLKNVKYPELLFNLGNAYVSSLTDTSYTTQMVFTGVSFQPSGGGVTASIAFENNLTNIYSHLGSYGRDLSADEIKENFAIIVTNKGTNTTFSNGDIVEWTSVARSAEISSDGSTVTFTATTGIASFTATVVAKVFVDTADSNYVRKYKKLVTANTAAVETNGTSVGDYTYVDDSTNSKGQVYILNDGLQNPGVPQSLYLSDVKRIVKIIDSKSPAVTPNSSMLSNASYDVTNNYTLDNGQRDSYYDHASIKLKPGAPKPKGNLLVLLDYYKHYGGDGYFCVSSYTGSTSPEQYQEIPVYTASSGVTYNLRDALDFRPSRVNAQETFEFKLSGSAGAVVGLNLPVDLTTFVGDYTYYLGRKDKLILAKDSTFKMIEGEPAVKPVSPAHPDDSMVIADITHDPYTGYIPSESPVGTISNLSVDKVKHKRYTMEDISGLENRIKNIEYYTSMSLLEQKTSALQISDSYGLNRFKNGILVDGFDSFAAADTSSVDFAANINRRERVMTPIQTVNNYPFKSSAMNSSYGRLSTDLGYNISSDGYINYYSLPYTTANVTSQKFASRTANVNPFAFITKDGTLRISPNVDNWVDTTKSPSLLIVDPNIQVFKESSTVNLLSAGDWKSIPGTLSKKQDVGLTRSGYVTTMTSWEESKTDIYGAYEKLPNTYSLNNGYLTDISILPYIRQQEITVSGEGMLYNTIVNTYFDGENVDNYFHKANIIELTGVSGTFKENDIVGYYVSNVFTRTGIVLGVYQKTSTTVRLYVAGDQGSTTYTTNGTLQNGFYNSSGAYTNSTASGTLSSSAHYGNTLKGVTNTTTIVLSQLASSTDSYYVGNTIYINAGTGAGQSATITAYTGSSRTATLSTAITAAVGDIYSIGTIKTDETGSVHGVFLVPGGIFHTGERIFRIDNSGGNKGSETTYAQSTFYSEGLHTTIQNVDYGASPSGAKNTFDVNRRQVAQNYEYEQIRDPLAQSFLVEQINYPNGLFIDSITVFFRTKPTSDTAPITLSIVNTLNGYPTGDTLDHSIVTLTPDKVKVSETPQYLDGTTKTVFKFNVPVFIQGGVLYAFILKSNSKEYTLWTASNGDIALKSSTKNLPTDPTPQVATKIASAPYVGGIFLSQNAQTWTADQNQALMFVMDRCKFTIASSPSIQYVIPKKLPQRTIFSQALVYANNANNVSTTIDSFSNDDMYYDALNITTTDFVPSSTNINYNYRATLSTGSYASTTTINPGKYGSPTPQNITLDDGSGKRMLMANSDVSLLLNATLSSTTDAVSPIVSDAGLSVYTVKYGINNCELSNSLVTMANTGSLYTSVANTTVTISAPTALGGTQAYAVANVVNGIVDAIYITSGGSGYIETPTVTISDSYTGINATAVIAGETSKNGGNADARYVTKKVTLDEGFDSGDLNVYLTAYRPVNTDINVYYKILSRNDTQSFDDSSWQLMTKISGTGSKYSSNKADLYEYKFAPGTGGVDQGYVSYTSSTGTTHTTFNQFAIKVVLTTSDTTSTPVVYDLRAIALPPNVNTTF